VTKEIMVIDYDKCVRYEKGDERFAVPLVRFRCPTCANGIRFMSEDEDGRPIAATLRYLTPSSFSAKMAPEGEPPFCSDHKEPIQMERY
jgi:hypothetical protein